MGRVVAVGGGHGLARALKALRSLDIEPTAIVTAADDGGSSGRLRRELGIIAPGDLRMALLALARQPELATVLAHRFQTGHLKGHALGNLLLVALAEQREGFLPALEAAERLLDCAGHVLPSTTVPVELRAQVAGARIDGQAHIARAGGRIERVWLSPADPPACPEAVDAILSADTIVLGPGSLFTSIAANLVVPAIGAALSGTPARLVYVGNLRTQPGETTGLDIAAHLDVVHEHLRGRRLDVALVHDGPVARDGGAMPLGTAVPEHAAQRIVRADLAERVDGVAGAAHDVGRLAAALGPVLASREATSPSA